MDVLPRIPTETMNPKIRTWTESQKLREARARDEVRRQERLDQQLIGSGQASIGKPRLVPSLREL